MNIKVESPKIVTGFVVGRKPNTYVFSQCSGVGMAFLNESNTEEKGVC